MSSESPPIEVLERIMEDKNKNYIYKMYEPSKQCTNNIMSELIALCDILIDDIGILTLPNLADSIKLSVVTILYNLNTSTLKNISLELDYQNNYIWTDDLIFKNTLNTSKNNGIDTMRHLLEKYYDSVVIILSDVIPKCIMYSLVEKASTLISNELYKIIKEQPINILLKEFDNIAEERANLSSSNEDLITINALFKSSLELDNIAEERANLSSSNEDLNNALIVIKSILTSQ